MRIPRLRSVAIIAAAGVGLGGCATYSPFGYGSGVSVSYGDRGYYDPYYGGYSRYGYSPYGYAGYGYGSRYGYGYLPYYGWHNGFYYPGTGYYVYDRNRRPRQLTDEERRYWTERASQPGSTLTRKLLDNWSGFSTGGESSAQSTQSIHSTQSIDGDRTIRVRRSGEARAPRQVQTTQSTRQSVRSERVSSPRAAARSERVAAARAERREARSERARARASAVDDE